MKVLECSKRKNGRGNVCLIQDPKDDTYAVFVNLGIFEKDAQDWYEQKEVAVAYYNRLAKYEFGTGY